MNETLAALENWGCDIRGALPRFLDDEAFMLECIGQVAEDPGFEELGCYLKENRTRDAFDTAHMLKGIIANTGLTPLYEIILTIVEPLRKGNGEGLAQPYERLMDKKNQLVRLLDR
jgi:hypothetical protein